MFDKMMVRGLFAAALFASAVSLQAGAVSIDMVPVGDAGNVADGGGGYGAVSYNYQIGKYDVTLGQYVDFLNAVAKTDTYGLYNQYMGTDFSTQGISQTGGPGSLNYAVTGSAPGAANMPVFAETWGDAARFCNWLQNGQPTSGAEAAGTTETGAYTLDGATSEAALMAVASPAHSGNGAAQYFLPSEDEWYKAAYYVGGGINAGYYAYPTKSNTAPINTLPDTGNHANFYDYYGTGNHTYTDTTNYLTPVGSFGLSPGPYGTYDMGGDVFQWNEANISGSFRGLRAGSWNIGSDTLASSSRFPLLPPTDEHSDIGFRVASSEAVPEPGSMALLLAGAVGLFAGVWRRRVMSTKICALSFLAVGCLIASGSPALGSTIWENSAGGSVVLSAFDSTTGLLIPGQRFFAPNPTAQEALYGGRGIAALGNDIYYTESTSGNIYKTNAVTHADLGVVVNTGFSGIASLATDGTYLYATDYGAANGVIDKYTTGGALVGTITLTGADATGAFQRDGFEVQNNPAILGGATTFIANRYDGGLGQTYNGVTGAYDVYDSSGNEVISGFITPNAQGTSGATGIAFDGTDYYVSDVSNSRLFEYSDTGAYVKTISLAPTTYNLEGLSALGNTTGNPAPEPSTIALLGAGAVGLLGFVLRRGKHLGV